MCEGRASDDDDEKSTGREGARGTGARLGDARHRAAQRSQRQERATAQAFGGRQEQKGGVSAALTGISPVR